MGLLRQHWVVLDSVMITPRIYCWIVKTADRLLWSWSLLFEPYLLKRSVCKVIHFTQVLELLANNSGLGRYCLSKTIKKMVHIFQQKSVFKADEKIREREKLLIYVDILMNGKVPQLVITSIKYCLFLCAVRKLNPNLWTEIISHSPRSKYLLFAIQKKKQSRIRQQHNVLSFKTFLDKHRSFQLWNDFELNR